MCLIFLIFLFALKLPPNLIKDSMNDEVAIFSGFLLVNMTNFIQALAFTKSYKT